MSARLTTFSERLAAAGRKPGCGWHFRGKYAEAIGFEMRSDLCGHTLQTILPELNKGRFVVRHAQHVFAVVDGVIYNSLPTALGLRVKMVYEYQRAA